MSRGSTREQGGRSSYAPPQDFIHRARPVEGDGNDVVDADIGAFEMQASSRP